MVRYKIGWWMSKVNFSKVFFIGNRISFTYRHAFPQQVREERIAVHQVHVDDQTEGEIAYRVVEASSVIDVHSLLPYDEYHL
jgi:hypothetical protein